MSTVDATTRRSRIAPAVDAPVGTPADLADFVQGSRRLFVLTGAGCSTGSGIPDYRHADGSWKRARPVEIAPFLREPHARARYWARSMVGWRIFGSAQPNAAHRALATLERSGPVGLLVTQNVDGLHSAAGSRRVLDLHGRLDRVACLGCRASTSREAWQRLLAERNPAWAARSAPVGPDGDADLEAADFDAFDVPDCPHCGGVVKPDVVFFGENVPAWRHAQATAALAASDAMLVVGSSLMVHSGYRYVLQAARRGTPVAAVNVGRTRADALLRFKVSADCATALASLMP